MSEVSEGRKRAYSSWRAMIRRCTDDKHPYWKNYGGRGIVICDRWLVSFDAFLEDMGARPEGTSIDRINNDGHYEPTNCRWATAKEQASNTRPLRPGHARGGRRPGAGAKPRGSVAMTKMFRAPAEPAQYEWGLHVAEANGMTVAEWLRSLVDRAIGEHECQECKAKGRTR